MWILVGGRRERGRLGMMNERGRDEKMPRAGYYAKLRVAQV